MQKATHYIVVLFTIQQFGTCMHGWDASIIGSRCGSSRSTDIGTHISWLVDVTNTVALHPQAPATQLSICLLLIDRSIDRKLIHACTFQCHALLFIAVWDNIVRVRVHVKISTRHRLHCTLFFFSPTENKIIQCFFFSVFMLRCTYGSGSTAFHVDPKTSAMWYLFAINLSCKQQHVESENMKYLASDAWSDSDNTHHQASASALSICTSSMQSELHTFFYLVYIQCCRRKDIVK
jgi:hypothetical protein